MNIQTSSHRVSENTPTNHHKRKAKAKKRAAQRKAEARAVLASIDNLTATSIPTSIDNPTNPKQPLSGNLLKPAPVVTENKPKRVFKVLVVGNSKCGKTSIIQRYANDTFANEYNITIGADYTKKIVEYEDGTSVRLQLWDIAGQDRFANLTRPYYNKACAAVVVCDVTRALTLEAVRAWKEELDLKLEGLPCVLLANKCDMIKNVSEAMEIGARIENLCSQLGFQRWFICSAKNDENVKDAMDFLLNSLMSEAKTSNPSLGLPRSQTGILLGNGNLEMNPGNLKQASCC